MTEAGRPVPHQTARAQREHARAEGALTAGENQKTRVGGDQVKTAELDAAVPADPVITRPTLQRRCREHRQRQPAPSMVRDIAHGLAHPRHRAEIVVCLHQVAEAGLVLRRHDVDGHLRKNRHGFPAPHDCRAALISGHGEEGHYLRQLPGRAGERAKYKSALPRMRCSWTRSGILSACLLILRNTPWCCASTKRVRSKPLTEPSRCCPCAPDRWTAARTTTSVTAQLHCLLRLTSRPARSSADATAATAARNSASSSTRSRRPCPMTSTVISSWTTTPLTRRT